MKSYCRVLTIAGSDSGGGAGIQADLKTMAANGCYGMSVITALTAQNTLGVTGIHAVPIDFVAAQIEAVLSDIGADAIKIGMLFSPELIQTVANTLQKFVLPPVVLDPVMISQSGHKLLQDDAIAALKQYLIPLASLITPNLPEASVLLNRSITTRASIESAAIELASLGCPDVLLKGGHLEEGMSDDCLYIGQQQRTVILPGERIVTRNNHGTGCTLSSAIASFLARGKSIEQAVRLAKEYITGAIRSGAGYSLGHGHGPVHHFFQFY